VDYASLFQNDLGYLDCRADCATRARRVGDGGGRRRLTGASEVAGAQAAAAAAAAAARTKTND